MTDQEVICAFMEPMPALPDYYSHLQYSPRGWWLLGSINGGGMRWFAARNGRRVGLDALWEVEERLTDMQWTAYHTTLLKADGWNGETCSGVMIAQFRSIAHATAEQKIKALAAVLRPVVEDRAEKGI